MTIGEMILPSSKPNLNPHLFNGAKIFDFNSPKIKKIKLSIISQYLGFSPMVKGYNAIIKKKAKNTKPKLLFDPILISLLFFILLKLIYLGIQYFLKIESI